MLSVCSISFTHLIFLKFHRGIFKVYINFEIWSKKNPAYEYIDILNKKRCGGTFFNSEIISLFVHKRKCALKLKISKLFVQK